MVLDEVTAETIWQWKVRLPEVDSSEGAGSGASLRADFCCG